MKIIIINLGSPCECLLSTSLIKGLRKKYKDPEIHFLVKTNECQRLFEFSKYVHNSIRINSVPKEFLDTEFDLAINLSADTNFDAIKLKAKRKKGFFMSEDTGKYKKAIYGESKINKNIFQIYYSLAGLVWEGEGFSFCYNPKSKSKKNRTGLLIANAVLRKYIMNKLNLDYSKIWNIPYRKNIFQIMDEVNKCGTLVTDDFTTMNIGLCLRKEIHFLKTLPYTTKIELFGNKLYKIPPRINYG